MTMRCDLCNIELETTMATSEAPFRYTGSGLDNVYLVGIEVLRCTICGREVPKIPRMPELLTCLNDAIGHAPGKLSGAEIKFLRKHRGASQVEFSRRLQVAPETLSRIENGHEKCGRSLESLIRTVALDGRGELNAYDLLGEFAEKAETEHRDNILANINESWQIAA